MTDDFNWGKASYNLLKEGHIVKKYPKSVCYSALKEFKFGKTGDVDEIYLYNIECKKTKDYTLLYLQYIKDMLKLDAHFTNEYFCFKVSESYMKNLLVCTLIRFLRENLFDLIPYPQTQDIFFKPLFTEKCTFRGKLQRFCYFYSKIKVDENNAIFAHSWTPSKTKIKSYTDYKLTKCNQVNTFFTTD